MSFVYDDKSSQGRLTQAKLDWCGAEVTRLETEQEDLRTKLKSCSDRSTRTIEKDHRGSGDHARDDGHVPASEGNATDGRADDPDAHTSAGEADVPASPRNDDRHDGTDGADGGGGGAGGVGGGSLNDGA